MAPDAACVLAIPFVSQPGTGELWVPGVEETIQWGGNFGQDYDRVLVQIVYSLPSNPTLFGVLPTFIPLRVEVLKGQPTNLSFTPTTMMDTLSKVGAIFKVSVTACGGTTADSANQLTPKAISGTYYVPGVHALVPCLSPLMLLAASFLFHRGSTYAHALALALALALAQT